MTITFEDEDANVDAAMESIISGMRYQDRLYFIETLHRYDSRVVVFIPGEAVERCLASAFAKPTARQVARPMVFGGWSEVAAHWWSEAPEEPGD